MGCWWSLQLQLLACTVVTAQLWVVVLWAGLAALCAQLGLNAPLSPQQKSCVLPCRG